MFTYMTAKQVAKNICIVCIFTPFPLPRENFFSPQVGKIIPLSRFFWVFFCNHPHIKAFSIFQHFIFHVCLDWDTQFLIWPLLILMQTILSASAYNFWKFRYEDPDSSHT